MDFCKFVISYYMVSKGGREDEAKECFKIFDKREKNQVSMTDVKTTLTEYVSPNLTDEDVKDFMKEIDPNNNGHIL